MPRATFTHTATTTAATARVWEALQKPETWEAIGGVDRITEAVFDDSGLLDGFTFEISVAGRRYVGEATLNERSEGRAIVWAIASDEVRGRTRVEIEPVGSGAEVTVSLEMESVGLLSTLLFAMISSAIGAGLPKSVEEFVSSLG